MDLTYTTAQPGDLFTHAWITVPTGGYPDYRPAIGRVTEVDGGCVTYTLEALGEAMTVTVPVALFAEVFSEFWDTDYPLPELSGDPFGWGPHMMAEQWAQLAAYATAVSGEF